MRSFLLYWQHIPSYAGFCIWLQSVQKRKNKHVGCWIDYPIADIYGAKHYERFNNILY